MGLVALRGLVVCAAAPCKEALVLGWVLSSSAFVIFVFSSLYTIHCQMKSTMATISNFFILFPIHVTIMPYFVLVNHKKSHKNMKLMLSCEIAQGA